MKNYKIISAKSPADLEEKVITHLGRGWHPLGGVCKSPQRFFQAMTSTKAPPKPEKE